MLEFKAGSPHSGSQLRPLHPWRKETPAVPLPIACADGEET